MHVPPAQLTTAAESMQLETSGSGDCPAQVRVCVRSPLVRVVLVTSVASRLPAGSLTTSVVVSTLFPEALTLLEELAWMVPQSAPFRRR